MNRTRIAQRHLKYLAASDCGRACCKQNAAQHVRDFRPGRLAQQLVASPQNPTSERSRLLAFFLATEQSDQCKTPCAAAAAQFENAHSTASMPDQSYVASACLQIASRPRALRDLQLPHSALRPLYSPLWDMSKPLRGAHDRRLDDVIIARE
jgi:hypothetical protein